MSTENLTISMKTILTLIAGASIAGYFMSDNIGHNLVHTTTLTPFVSLVLVPILERLLTPAAR